MIKMYKKYKNYFIAAVAFLCIEILLCLPVLICFPLLRNPDTFSVSVSTQQKIGSYLTEKRGSPIYDAAKGEDGWLHYRVFFWVPKTATKLIPYADAGIKTDVSSHGPVEKWAVVETKISDEHEKLVFIYVPKTFVYLYGNGFERVIHLKYSL